MRLQNLQALPRTLPRSHLFPVVEFFPSSLVAVSVSRTTVTPVHMNTPYAENGVEVRVRTPQSHPFDVHGAAWLEHAIQQI